MGEGVIAHVCVLMCVCVCKCLWWTKDNLRHCSSRAIPLGLEAGSITEARRFPIRINYLTHEPRVLLCTSPQD